MRAKFLNPYNQVKLAGMSLLKHQRPTWNTSQGFDIGSISNQSCLPYDGWVSYQIIRNSHAVHDILLMWSKVELWILMVDIRQQDKLPPLYLLVAISDLYLQIPHSGMWIKCQIADYVPLMQ